MHCSLQRLCSSVIILLTSPGNSRTSTRPYLKRWFSKQNKLLPSILPTIHQYQQFTPLKFDLKMHQTKIGQFFKKAPPKEESPVKNGSKLFSDDESRGSEKESPPLKVKMSFNKKDAKVDVENSDKKPKKEVNGTRKRKSIEASASDDSDTGVKRSKKKLRKKIIVQSSSESEEDEKVPTSNTKKDDDSPEVKKSEDEREKTDEEPVHAQKSDDKINKTSKKRKETLKTQPKTKEVKVEKSTEDDGASGDSKEKEEKSSASPDNESKPKRISLLSTGSVPKGWNPDYDPTKSKYHPIDDATWERGQKVPYLALAKTLEAIEATSSRLKFIEILSNYFRSVIVLSPEDLLCSVYLCLNKLAPAYEGVELGVAETNVMKAIAQATGRSLDKLKVDAQNQGDLGLVAESSRSNQKTLFQPQPLTVSGVFVKLKEIASLSGTASHAKKISMITSMLVACKYSEARFLTRSLLGKLRIGLAEQSLLQALSQATYLTPPDQNLSKWPPKILNAGSKHSAETLKGYIEEHAFVLKSCYCECPNYDILVKALLECGIKGLPERCKLTPGIPPRPMLAQPTKGVADVLDRFEGIRFSCEYKYDGERAQIHLLEDGSVRIYSRNQENNTSKYPDIISRFQSCIVEDVKSCIIDTEAVAWDLENKQILPFQVLSTRKRKDANEADIKVQVCIFAFDLIYLNGESLIKKTLAERRDLLRKHFKAVEGQFCFATSLDTDSMEEVQEFLEKSVKGNCEGLMVKTLHEKATYELAKRSQKWLKLKKDYLDSGGDSLDLVVIGGFMGKGKRTGTYGGFLLACYDPDEEVYQTICKIGTGFSDEQLQQHTEALKPHVIPSPKSYYRFNQQLVPDHWFDTVQVWEVKCADLSLSPVHTAAEGIVDNQKGISLRFPRFLKIREDKNVEDATSSRQVADMYKNQEQVKNSSKDKKVDDEEDFY